MRIALLLAILPVLAIALAADAQNTVAVELRGERARELDPAALSLLGARLTRTYDAATVVRLPQHAIASLRELARGKSLTVVEHPEWDRVHLPGAGALDRSATIPPLEDYSGGAGLYVIQFDSPIAPADHDELLKHGLEYVAYLPYNAMLVVGQRSSVDQISHGPNVRWVFLYRREYRAQISMLETAGNRYIVQVANVAGAAGTLARIASAAHGPVAHVQTKSFINVHGAFDGSFVVSLASDPYVIMTQRDRGAVLAGEREAIAVTNSFSQYMSEPYHDFVRPYKPDPGADYRYWLHNRGVLETSQYRIAFVDTGFGVAATNPPRPQHPDLDRSNIVWENYTTDPAHDKQGHGTLVIGMAAGNPPTTPPQGMTQKDGDSFFFGMGIAPQTGFISQKIFDDFGRMAEYGTAWDYLTVANNASYYNATIQNHSYVWKGTAGDYDSMAQIVDVAVRDTYGDAAVTPMPMTVAAGNICQLEADGNCTTSVMSIGTAKNVITVGGVESYRPNAFSQCESEDITALRQPGDFWADSFRNVAWSSRRGTDDGRLKPEIVAPMNQVSSTRTQYTEMTNGVVTGGQFFCNHTSDGYYTFDSGTSFSAPQVAAAAVLINKKHGRLSATERFTPAMLKASLVGNSVSVRGGIDRQTGNTVSVRGPAPGQSQGFGRLSLGEALSGQTVQTFLDESSWQSFTGSGQQRSRSFTVADTSKPVTIVLAWTDEAATPYAPVTLVRDLDLTVPLDSCSGYTGNDLDSYEYSIVQGSSSQCNVFVFDTRNNLEMIVIPPNSRTSFDVRISTTTWGGSSPQPFALFVSNGY